MNTGTRSLLNPEPYIQAPSSLSRLKVQGPDRGLHLPSHGQRTGVLRVRLPRLAPSLGSCRRGGGGGFSGLLGFEGFRDRGPAATVTQEGCPLVPVVWGCTLLRVIMEGPFLLSNPSVFRARSL